jgi:hypothetical protein
MKSAEDEVKSMTVMASPRWPARWRDGEVSGWRGASPTCQQRWFGIRRHACLTRGAARRLREIVSAAVELAGAKTRGAALGGASWQEGRAPAEGWSGVQRVQGDQAAPQTVPGRPGRQGKPRRRQRSKAPVRWEEEEGGWGSFCKL